MQIIVDFQVLSLFSNVYMCGEMGFALGWEITPEKLHVTEVLRASFKSAPPLLCVSEGKRFPLPGRADWLLPFVLASSLLTMSHTYCKNGTWTIVLFAMFLLFCCNNAELSPATLWPLCSAAPVCYPNTGAACYFLGCKGERPCVFSASHEFYFIFVFLFSQDSDISPWEKLWCEETILSHVTCCT